jgi:hypothetical protein
MDYLDAYPTSFNQDFGLGTNTYGDFFNPNISYTPSAGWSAATTSKPSFGSRIGNMFKGGGDNMFGALAGGLFSFLGARSAAAAQAAATEAQLKASADQMKFGIMRGREQDKGSMGFGIGQAVTRYGTGADLDFDRQKRGSVFSKTRGRDLTRMQNIADARANLGFRLSPGYGQMKRGQLNRRIKEMKAAAMMSPEAMKYGPIAFRSTV